MSSSRDALPIEVDCTTVRTKLDAGESFLLLDCREPHEHVIAHIPDAQLIPMSELPDRVGDIEAYRDSLVIVHCHHGGRSLRVASWLRQNGFTRAQSMAGGIDEWSQTIDRTVPRY